MSKRRILVLIALTVAAANVVTAGTHRALIVLYWFIVALYWFTGTDA